MTNMKFKVDSREQSKQLQEVLFSLGCEWKAGGKCIRCLSMPYIFVHDDIITYGIDRNRFIRSGSVEIITQKFIDEHKKEIMKESKILLKQATKKQAIDFINYELMLRADTRASLLDAVDRIDSIFVNVKLAGDSCSEYYIEPCTAYTKFIYYRPISGNISDALRNPEDFDHVKCIGKSVNGLDVMVAWEDSYPEWKRVYYLGKWNDGNIRKNLNVSMHQQLKDKLLCDFGRLVLMDYVDNYDLKKLDFINSASTPSSALRRAFSWIESPQGHEYWRSIYEKLEKTEQ